MHQHINGVKTVLPNRVVTATVNVKVAPTSIHSCCDGLTHGALQLECITCSVRVGTKTRCSFIIGNLPVRDTLVKLEAIQHCVQDRTAGHWTRSRE